jgi:hypothetical protein
LTVKPLIHYAFHVGPDLAGIEVDVAAYADARRTTGRAYPGGRFDHGVVSKQRDTVLADHNVLMVDAGYDDGVARVRGVDSLLDRLARPHDIPHGALHPGGPDATDYRHNEGQQDNGEHA